MPWVRVWIHFVWSTKNREPYLNRDIRQDVFAHIRENARAKNIHIDCMNGYVDQSIVWFRWAQTKLLKR